MASGKQGHGNREINNLITYGYGFSTRTRTLESRSIKFNIFFVRSRSHKHYLKNHTQN